MSMSEGRTGEGTGSLPPEPPEGLQAALRQFDACAFFEAHESLEEIWLPATGASRELLHALLQIAVGFHHAQQGNAHGTAALLGRALARLERCPSRAWGLDLAALRDHAARFRDRAADGRLADAVADGFPTLIAPDKR